MECIKRLCVVTVALAWVAGCAPEQSGPSTATSASAVTATSTSSAVRGMSRTLGWGSASGQVGATARGNERVAEGPSAVAVGPDGAVYLLDRLNGRVIRVTERTAATVASVPVDSEDLAVGTDRGGDSLIAVWSLLRARVTLRVGGQDAGEVTVPRALRLARGLTLDDSRQVLVHNAHQETYRLGSPATGRSLPAVLRSKREGAYFLADGSGVQVRRRPGSGRAEVLVLQSGERTTVKRRLLLDDVVMGVRLVGAAGGHVCLRLEKNDSAAQVGSGLRVRREVVCVRASDGVEVLRQALSAPGRYLPRRELALGGSPARLAWIHATNAGLAVQVWTLPAVTVEVSR